MAKKRKTATKKSRKSAAPSKTATPTPPAAKSQKFSHDDQIAALVIAVAIVIAFVALYLYQNAKPKIALLDGGPAIVAIEKAAMSAQKT
ncbi:MAG: hypothetical protein HY244_18200 [Rhizobiales bacterium]|nr:hypothetical protein [Hyphomicrobiales bacterium]